MKKCRFYHGTVTGKDDVFLEGFIVTGAVSDKTEKLVQQEGGFYTSLSSPGTAYNFSYTVGLEAAQRQYKDQHTLRYGRGIIIELEAEINARDWDFDHEFFEKSMEVIKPFKDILPFLTFNTAGSDLEDTPTKKAFSIRKGKDPGQLIIDYEDVSGKKKSFEMSLENMKFTPPLIFFLSQIHETLKNEFPERYWQVKQGVLDGMAKIGSGDLKYVGNQPLRVNKIYLRPEDENFRLKDDSEWKRSPLARWEVVYSSKAPRTGSPNQKPAKMY